MTAHSASSDHPRWKRRSPWTLPLTALIVLGSTFMTQEAEAYYYDITTGQYSARQRPHLAFIYGLLSNPNDRLVLWIALVALSLALLRRNYLTYHHFLGLTAKRFHQPQSSRTIEGVRWGCNFKITFPRWIWLSETAELIISPGSEVTQLPLQNIERAAAQIRTARKPESVEVQGNKIQILIYPCLPTWTIGANERAEEIKKIRDGCIGALLNEMRFVPGFRPPECTPPPIPSDTVDILPPMKPAAGGGSSQTPEPQD